MNQGVRFVSYNRMDKKRRVYQPRVFDGRIITFDEIERIHKEVLKFKRIEAISDPMPEFIETCGPSWCTSCRRRACDYMTYGQGLRTRSALADPR